MEIVKIYGIKNCDTMKKAMKWLEENEIDIPFHDYKKEGVDEAILKLALDQHGWEMVINKRGTSWRAMDNYTKTTMSNDLALKVAKNSPSLIKRPLLLVGDRITLGFAPAIYSEIFSINPS